MNTLTLILAAGLCLAAPAAYAQMDQSSSQAARAALNGQQADMAQQQLDQDAADRQAYEAAQAARQARIDRHEANYDAAMQMHYASVHEYHEAMRAWRADVAACEAGDRSRCDHTQPGP